MGFGGDARGDAPGDTFKKVPPRPPSKLFGKSFESSQRWRSQTEVEGGHSHLRRRQGPPRPCRLAPTILRFTEVFRFQTYQYLHSHKITSVDLCHNIPSLHNSSVLTPCLYPKNKSHPVKSALARTLGVSVQKIVTVGKHFRIESENAPSLFGRVARNLSRKKGFSGCFPLVSFLCRSKGKYTTNNRFSNTSF